MSVEPLGVKAPAGKVETRRISVVIPAYNASAYLAASLQSIFSQTSPPGEVIVVDDGSTDDSAKIARSFGARVISLPNGGVARARNAGTAAASGEYIAYMDADDLWMPAKLELQFAALESYGRAAFSFTDYRVFDEKGIYGRSSGLCHHPAFRKVRKSALKMKTPGQILIAAVDNKPVLPDCYIQPSSVLVRRADVLAVGGFDERFKHYEDYELFLRLFKIVPAIAVMQPLLLYRRHAGQATANHTSSKSAYIDIARRVVSSPERYPCGDVRYLPSTEFWRYYRLGVEQGRNLQFESATESFERSLASRWTIRAAAALLGSRLCQRTAWRRALEVVRMLWKRRPRSRSR